MWRGEQVLEMVIMWLEGLTSTGDVMDEWTSTVDGGEVERLTSAGDDGHMTEVADKY